MTVIPRPADRDDWLEVRHDYFNASDAACLLDRHPFKTLAEVVEAKLAPVDLDTPENVHMIRGRHLEAAVAGWFEDEHGIALYEPTHLYRRGWCLATLDRKIVGVDDRALEIKTTSRTIVEPEPYWVDQCQLQMHCADLAAVDIVAMDATLTLQSFEVKRDDEAIAAMVARAEEIMAAVRRGQWPDDVPRSTTRTRATGAEVELDDDTVTAVAELAEVRERLRALRDDEDHLRRLIVQRLGDASVGVHDGRNIVRNAVTSRRRLDERRLRADHPELVADYETTSSYTTLRVLR